MISSLSKAAAAGLPWWAWILIILLVVVLLSVVFEKLEGKPKDAVPKENPREVSQTSARTFASVDSQPRYQYGAAGTVSTIPRSTGPLAPPATADGSQPVVHAPISYGSLGSLAASHHSKAPGQQQHQQQQQRSSSKTAVPMPVTVGPTHSMPLTRHSLQTAQHQQHVAASGRIPQTGAPVTMPARVVSPPRTVSPPRQRQLSQDSVGSLYTSGLSPTPAQHVGSPTHSFGTPRANQMSHSQLHAGGLHSYPSYGHLQGGPAASPPGTWPHNYTGAPAPLTHSVSYDGSALSGSKHH